jgi:hypothetical protein
LTKNKNTKRRDKYERNASFEANFTSFEENAEKIIILLK